MRYELQSKSVGLILMLISFLSFAQLKVNDRLTIPDDALHFYGAFAVNEGTYQIQSCAFPKWKESRKLLVSNLTTVAVIFGKEIFDKHKAHPTGFSWDDIFMGSWSIPIYNIFNICRHDYRHRNDYLIPLQP